MARSFLKQIQTANGLVQSVAFDTLLISDLPFPGDATKFLDGTGAFSTPSGGGGGGGGSSFSLTPPVDGDFSWVNQGGGATATVSTDFGSAVVLSIPGSGSKQNRLRVKNAPATPYTITAYFKVLADPSDFWNAGLTFYDSGSGKMAGFQVSQVGAPVLGSSTFNSVTSFDADYRSLGLNLFPHGMEMLLRIADTGVNRVCSWSVDGVNFQTFHSVGRTNFLTANQVGFWANSQNSIDMKMILLSWLEG